MNNNEIIEEYFNNTILKSWTWQRLTDFERFTFLSIRFDCCKGTKKQRIEIFNCIYLAFLVGLGYTPTNWREETESPLF